MSTAVIPLRNGPHLYTTKFVVWREERQQPMTVGIGALCQSGQCVILGSDTRASYDPKFHLGPNDWTSKLYRLPHACFVSVAGILSECHALCSQLAAEFGKFGDNFELDEARNAINAARFYKRDQMAGDRIQAKFGVSLADWQKLPMDAAVYKGGTNILDRIPIKCEIIVGGFKNKNPEETVPGSTAAILYRAIGKHPIEAENNFTTIGTGGNEALKALDKRGQNVHRSWQRTAIDMIAAMRAARRGNKKTVGKPNNLVLICYDRVKRFPVEATFVKTLLEKTRKAKISDTYDFDEATNKTMESLLEDDVPE